MRRKPTSSKIRAIATEATRLSVAASAGALVMYLADPDRGRARRSETGGRIARLARDADHSFWSAVRDAGNRAAGWVAEIQSAASERDVPDTRLIDRVRSKLGRLVSHPGAIHVEAIAGRVTLSGPILSSEAHRLLKGVREIRGVRHVENRLEPHGDPSHVPGLQGRGPWPHRWELRRPGPTPAARLVSLGGGGLLVAWTARDPRPGRWLPGLVGLGLLGYGASQRERVRVAPAIMPQPGLEIRKALMVHAPPERVFDFWSALETFPRFLSHVRQVRRLERGRSHWTIGGAEGLPLEFNAQITRRKRPRLIAWRTVAPSDVHHHGTLTFSGLKAGTLVSLRLVYRQSHPDAMARLAKLLGPDPEREIHEDLMRMKHFMETGIAAEDQARLYSTPEQIRSEPKTM